MTDRPTESLDWATSGTNILAPSSGKRAQGWLPGEAPPAQNFNWWKNLAGQWVDYIVERLDGLDIPTNVALLHEPNEFTRAITLTNGDAATALLGSDSMAEDSGHAGNRWKLLQRYQTTAGQYIRVYSGRNTDPSTSTPDVLGAYAITLNAEWSVFNQRWDQMDAGHDSTALLWFHGRMRVAAKPAGTAHWSDWDHAATGTLQVGILDAKGAISGETLEATTGDIASTLGSIGAHFTVGAGTDVVAGQSGTGEFLYGTAQARSTRVDLSAAQLVGSGPDHSQALVFGAGYVLALTAAGVASVPINLPSGALLDSIDVVHSMGVGGSGENVFKVMRTTISSWNTASNDIAAICEPIVALVNDARAGISITTGVCNRIDLGGYAIQNANESYYLECALAAGSRLYAVRLNWRDPGPRNH